MSKSVTSFFKKFFFQPDKRSAHTIHPEPNDNFYNKNNLLSNFYSVLIHTGFIPQHIVDVGANHGTWTRETLKYFPNAYYTLLEPQHEMQNSIKDILENNSKVRFHPLGAGDKTGKFKFTFVHRDDSCSFIYTEEEAKSKGYEQVEIPMVTLNEFLHQTNLPSPDIIKIDAEGIDLNVLKGASNFFGETEIFMTEAGVVNKSFPNSMLEIINFMDVNGYRFFDITDLNRPIQPGVLWLIEAAFVKKGGIIDSFKWPAP